MAKDSKAGNTGSTKTGATSTYTANAREAFGGTNDNNKYIVSTSKVKTNMATVTNPGTNKANIFKGIVPGKPVTRTGAGIVGKSAAAVNKLFK